MLGREVAEDFDSGRIARFGLLSTGQFQFVEEHFAKLLRRADGEFPARQLMNGCSEPLDFNKQRCRELAELGLVCGNAEGLHLGQNRNQRLFDAGEDRELAFLLESILQDATHLV